MKVLVTGGFGNIGRSLVKDLLSHGHDVAVLSRTKIAVSTPSFNGVKLIQGDIVSEEEMKKACTNIDCVIHLAALDKLACKADPVAAIMTNGLGTRTLLEAAASEGVSRFIYMSSIHIYGALSGKITENTLPDPKSDYAIGKFLGECYCKNYCDFFTSTIVRLSNSFGPPVSGTGWDLVVNNFCKSCFEDQKVVLRASGDIKKNFISLSDVNSAIMLLMSSDKNLVNGKAFNLGGGETVSIRELAELVISVYKELYGKEAKLISSDSTAVSSDFDYDCSRLKDLGFESKTSLRAGIIRMFKFIESEKNG